MSFDATKLARPPTAGPVNSGPTHINMKRNDPFVLAHFPTEWELVEEDGDYWWLPRLKKLGISGGVNGVRVDRGRVQFANAKTDYEARGFTLISEDSVIQAGPGNLPEGGYRVEYPGTNGKVHLCRWDVPKVLGGQVIIKTCAKTHNAFRRSLVEQGIIGQPDPDALEIVTERMRTRIARKAKQAHIPAVKAEIEHTEDLLAATKLAHVPGDEAHVV